MLSCASFSAAMSHVAQTRASHPSDCGTPGMVQPFYALNGGGEWQETCSPSRPLTHTRKGSPMLTEADYDYELNGLYYEIECLEDRVYELSRELSRATRSRRQRLADATYRRAWRTPGSRRARLYVRAGRLLDRTYRRPSGRFAL